MTSTLMLFAVMACAQRSPPAGLYRLGGAEQSRCPRPVQLLDTTPAEAFQELASISATCPYTSPTTCERSLLRRGCELAADAVVLRQSNVMGRRAKPQLAEEAVAIRFAVNPRSP